MPDKDIRMFSSRVPHNNSMRANAGEVNSGYAKAYFATFFLSRFVFAAAYSELSGKPHDIMFRLVNCTKYVVYG